MQRKHLEQEKELNNWRAACLHALQKLFLKDVLSALKFMGTENYFLTKYMHMTKTHKAWVSSVTQFKSCRSKIVHFLQHTSSKTVVLFNSKTLTMTLLYNGTKLPRSWIYTNKKYNKWEYIYILCWQICGNEYKTLRDCMTVLVMDSKMSIVSCSLRKQFIASPQNSHMSTTSSFVPFQQVIKTTYSKPTFANIFKAKSFKFIILQNRT